MTARSAENKIETLLPVPPEPIPQTLKHGKVLVNKHKKETEADLAKILKILTSTKTLVDGDELNLKNPNPSREKQLTPGQPLGKVEYTIPISWR